MKHNVSNKLDTRSIYIILLIVLLLYVANADDFPPNITIYIEESCPHHRLQRRSLFPTEQPMFCPPCEQIHCSQEKIKCKGRKTLGICGCCKVCAKLEEERCGGQHDYLGKCDRGLFCEPQKPTMISFERDGVRRFYRVDTGICKKDYPKKWPSLCKPKCTPEFCSQNPRAICSAIENNANIEECANMCQHTSCRACKFVQPEEEEECPSCDYKDFKCIRNFGRCIRRKTCKNKYYPCKNIKIIKRRITNGVFRCEVPKCVNSSL